MTLNFKKIVLAVGVSLTVIVVCSVLYYVFTVRSEQQRNDVVEPGRFSDSSLKYVTILFRHGNRAPMFKYETDPYKNAFPGGNMGLTKKGKQNMYKKGQFFRRLYNGFLNDLYLENEILVKTTNTSRAFMSAALVLAGMYPPKNYQKWTNSETVWQPIPIYSDSPDRILLIGTKGICPSIDRFLADLHKSTDKNITELLSFLSENCGQPINSKDVSLLYDLILCYKAEGLPVPEWIQPHHLATMESIYSEKTKTLYGNTNMLKLLVGPLLNEIGLNMELSSNNYNTTRKTHLYSGHDISIGMAMNFLGHTIESPGFGASLHFHMHHDVSNGYIIKVFYFDRWDNEKGEEISTPICGNPCKLEDFKKLLNNNFSGRWEDECQ